MDNNEKDEQSNKKRLSPGSLDEHYIDAYEEFPTQKKVKLLRLALKAAGIDDVKATRQRAYEIHARLADKLETRLMKRAQDARSLGLTTLIKLCKDAESEAIKASVATTLTKDIFPNVSVKKQETIEDLDERINKLQDGINKQENLH